MTASVMLGWEVRVGSGAKAIAGDGRSAPSGVGDGVSMPMKEGVSESPWKVVAYAPAMVTG